MKTCLILTALVMVMGTAHADTDWKKVEDLVSMWQSQTKMLISQIEKVVFKDNAAIGEKVKPILQEHQSKALNKIEVVEGAAKGKTLTRDKATEIALEVLEIFQNLKAVTAGDQKQLSEEGRTHLREVCEEGKDNIQKTVASIIEEIKE